MQWNKQTGIYLQIIVAYIETNADVNLFRNISNREKSKDIVPSR